MHGETIKIIEAKCVLNFSLNFFLSKTLKVLTNFWPDTQYTRTDTRVLQVTCSLMPSNVYPFT